MSKEAYMTVITYQHAPHYGGRGIALCASCATEDTRTEACDLPSLGPVSHGLHAGQCQCPCHATRASAVRVEGEEAQP
jgi:hypothetical protein